MEGFSKLYLGVGVKHLSSWFCPEKGSSKVPDVIIWFIISAAMVVLIEIEKLNVISVDVKARRRICRIVLFFILPPLKQKSPPSQ